ncbi:uncharacterized protein EI90DRAFT_3124019 [Cantharellus anzutake]|uniref:uncharacterized protein n=1 Tax=Cantharellus anzutake TaxID=1750568 RepID=UPI0019082CA9|nr:uncharacterized protein EI90DRAFT_3124019 [Cantharellus anzutake]KAF8330802.1 hypothetical protein EI90DRAFT_3124019 [Cantharellus anzutake]
MSRAYVLAESQGIFQPPDSQGNPAPRIWFKTGPVTERLVQRLVRVQLKTESCDPEQVVVTSNWRDSWFEICILASDAARELKRKGKRVLSWRSHSNMLASGDSGFVFGRESQLVGDIIAVQVCSPLSARGAYLGRGKLIVEERDEGIIDSVPRSVAKSCMPERSTETTITLSSTNNCEVHAVDDKLECRIWLKSPPLDKCTISNIHTVQLFTVSRGSGNFNFGGACSWSWFDILILDSPDAKSPKVVNGVSLVWKSHHNSLHNGPYEERRGDVLYWDNPLLFLDDGNVIAVRICARFPGWSNYVKEGHLLIGVKEIEAAKSITTSPLSICEPENLSFSNDSLETLGIPSEPAPAYSSPSTDSILEQRLGVDQTIESARPLRLLSLDGGGVRGISTLVILKEIMKKVTSEKDPRPCDYFDMIAGTSTGGLIALMLGRLHMTINECTEEYERLAKELFTRGRLGKFVGVVTTGARYDANILKNGIQDLLQRKLGDSEALMLEKDPLCRVLLMAARSDRLNRRTAAYLRTYDSPNAPPQKFPPFRIWEAARATSAAPTIFEEVRVGRHTFVDGGLGFNNPVQELVNEAFFLYGATRPIGCITSIGTGLGKNVPLHPISVIGFKHFVRGLVSVASGCERSHERMIANSLRLPPVGEQKYFRFNVGERVYSKWVEETVPDLFNNQLGTVIDKPEEDHFKAGHIHLDEYQRMHEFAALSRKYMAETEQQKLLQRCAKRLYPTTLTPTGVLIRGQMRTNEGMGELESQSLGDVCVAGSKLRETVNESLLIAKRLSSEILDIIVQDEDECGDPHLAVPTLNFEFGTPEDCTAVKRRKLKHRSASPCHSLGSVNEALAAKQGQKTKEFAILKGVRLYFTGRRVLEAQRRGPRVAPFQQLFVPLIRTHVSSWAKVRTRAPRDILSTMICFILIAVLVGLLVPQRSNNVDGFCALPIRRASTAGKCLIYI